MAIGPGKYDDVCTRVREEEGATAVAVIIAGGKRGGGFSVQSSSLSFIGILPAILREAADQIEAGIRERTNGVN